MKLLSSVCCLLLISVNLYQVNVQAQLSDLKTLLTVVQTIYNSLPAVKAHLTNGKKTPQNTMIATQHRIFNKLTQLSDDVASAKERILGKITQTLRNKLSLKTDEVFRYVEDINISYKFLQNMNSRRLHSKAELLRFARANTEYSLQELAATLSRLHTSFLRKDINGDSILSLLTHNSDEYDTKCIRGQSAQQIIYDLYKIVVDSDIKGLLVELFSLDILKKYSRDKHVDFDERINDTKKDHIERLNVTYNVVKTYMKAAPRTFGACGRVDDKLGVTYTKLDVFQGFFMNEMDTTSFKLGFIDTDITKFRLIMNHCDDYVDERYRCNSDACKEQPADRKCNHLRDCSFIDNDLQVCHSPKGSDRRYDWMKDLGNDVMYGNYYDSCKNVQHMSGRIAVNMCFCNCENDAQKALRYFSLHEVKSDVLKNKVVTGVRLQKVGYVIYLQIQQGVLAPYGQINGNVEWKSIQTISEKDLLATKVSKYNYEDKGDGRYEEWTEFYKNDLVYTVTYKTNTIFLDDIDVLDDNLTKYIVTGIRFSEVDKALRFDVEYTEFTPKTGKLIVQNHFWNYTHTSFSDRREAEAKINNIPTQSINDIYSSENQFVRFKMSDARKDVSQNTIPFIDLQPVVPKAESPLPLTGAGIYYKYDERHAGYIGLKVMHYDLAAHL